MEYVSSLDIVKNQNIKVDKSGIRNTVSHSIIIKISLLTPNLGEGFTNISDLNPGELAWSSDYLDKEIKDKSYDILYKSNTLKPWKLILKR